MTKEYLVGDFSEFKVTGTLVNGKRFRIVTSDYWYMRGINVFRGNKWGRLKSTLRWIRLESIWN